MQGFGGDHARDAQSQEKENPRLKRLVADSDVLIRRGYGENGHCESFKSKMRHELLKRCRRLRRAVAQNSGGSILSTSSAVSWTRGSISGVMAVECEGIRLGGTAMVSAPRLADAAKSARTGVAKIACTSTANPRCRIRSITVIASRE